MWQDPDAISTTFSGLLAAFGCCCFVLVDDSSYIQLTVKPKAETPPLLHYTWKLHSLLHYCGFGRTHPRTPWMIIQRVTFGTNKTLHIHFTILTGKKLE